MKLLLVEDEPAIAQNIIERLKSEFYKVEWADNGDDGLKEAGKVGLWTKADAVTFFDNFQLKILETSKL